MENRHFLWRHYADAYTDTHTHPDANANTYPDADADADADTNTDATTDLFIPDLERRRELQPGHRCAVPGQW